MMRKHSGTHRVLIISIAVVLAIGCVHQQPQEQLQPVLINQATRDRLKTETNLQAAVHQPVQFYVVTREINEAFKTTTGRAALAGLLGGAIGGVILATAPSKDPVKLIFALGDEMVKKYQLEDPAKDIAIKVVAAAGNQLGKAEIPFSESDVDDAQADKLDDFKRRFGRGLLFDFQTLGWGIIQVNKEEPDYNHVAYYIRARLIDVDNNTTLWQAVCEIRPSDANKPATLTELAANSGEEIKKRLVRAGDLCVSILKSQLLLEKPV